MYFRCTKAAAALVALAAILSAVRAATGNPLDGLSQLRATKTERASSTAPDWRQGPDDFRHIAPGAAQVVADLSGPGIIRHIWNTVGTDAPHYSRLLRLRMYWDGEAEPSVDVPLGDFFAAGHGIDANVDSLPVSVSSNGRARNCFWPMPFRKSARITLTNEAKQGMNVYWYVDWERVPRLDRNEAYFHAQYRQAFPVQGDADYMVADIVGRGHYVGTVMSVRSRAGGWWGEGDDHFFVDGETEPSVRGTGTEDYFSQAYGVFPDQRPWYGTPLWTSNEAVDARTTCYRWQVPDPVTFTKSLRFELEHKGVTWKPDGTIADYNGVRHDDFATVAYWYQTEPHKPFPPMPVGYDRLDEVTVATIEAESLIANATATAGEAVRQELGGKSGGAQLHWIVKSADQTLTVPFEVAEAGTYNFVLPLTKSWDYGIFQVELDGKPLGEPLNLYSPNITQHDLRQPALTLTAGKHTLRFVNKGKDDRSTGYLFGLDAILFTRWR